MTSMIPLGKFEQVDLKQAWPTEDGNFTPWLALPESISLLGEEMEMELEVEAVEHWVGAFKADILARVVDETDHRVIIEADLGLLPAGRPQVIEVLGAASHRYDGATGVLRAELAGARLEIRTTSAGPTASPR